MSWRILYFISFYSSRKRRPSTGSLYNPALVSVQAQGQGQGTPSGDGKDGGMEECAAAMVLMSLSCSPHSPKWDQNGNY